MPITPASVRLAKKLRAELLTITNKRERELVAAWARAWDEVAGDLELAITQLVIDAGQGTVTRAQALRSARLRNALAHIADQLALLTDRAGVQLAGDLAQVVRDAAQAQQAIIAAQLPPAERASLAGWDRVDARQLNAIVQRTTEQITSQLWPVSSETDAIIRRELIRGVAAGSNPRQTAQRMLKRAEGGFNGGLARALTIARTETLDAHRAAAAVGQRANADVLAGWIWLTSLAGKVCSACLGMAGTVHPLTESGPNGHQRCRCSRMPKTKSWKELGIDLPEQPDQVPNAENWFNKQPVKRQKEILGPARYKAWKAGKYPMSQWAVKKQNPGWRPSYVRSSVGAGRSERLAS